MANADLPHVCLPINLDAFVLNEKVCTANGNSFVAPITQPNYLGLRLESSHVLHDILPTVDLHNSRDGAANPRISDNLLKPFTRAADDADPPRDATSSVNRQRCGIYLHWSLPRAFRAAKSATPTAEKDTDPKHELQDQPVFPYVPNRWLIVRTIHPGWAPAELDPGRVRAWIVESDRLRKVEELSTDILGDPDRALDIDLETDVAPFVAYSGADPQNDRTILDQQAENYLGARTLLENWHEQKGTHGASTSGTTFVDLSVMNSSNPLFADYAPHNGNVFSIKDNLYCGNGRYLESATCDYVVLGWHSDPNDDPLWSDTSSGLGARLSQLFCQRPANRADLDQENDDRRVSTKQTRLICHAAKYSVRYSAEKPHVTRADDYASKFTADVDMEPVSVGTSPLDAALAFIHAHSGPQDTAIADVLKDTQTATDLHSIRELLYATGDDYDSRVKAADLVYAQNFVASSGGSHWQYFQHKDQSGPPLAPSNAVPDITKISAQELAKNPLLALSEVQLMARINDAQRRLDAATQEGELLRWNLFAEWFKYISDPLHGATTDRIEMYKSRVKLARQDALRLIALQNACAEDVAAIQSFFAKRNVKLKKVGQDSFYRRTDPTLCLAGIDSGWDPAFTGQTPTRFVDRVKVKDDTSADPPGLDAVRRWLGDVQRYSLDQPTPQTSSDLSQTLIKLLNEAIRGPGDLLQQTGFTAWDGQPFAPQFIEWEGIYYHVPWSEENWDIKLTTSAIAESNHKQFMYTNPRKLAGYADAVNDHRAVSGRMLILPQPAFALGAIVAQVLDASNDDKLPAPFRDPAKKQDLIKKAQALRFVSGELSGLTEALLTMSKGQHVKPNVRQQGKRTLGMWPAKDAGKGIDMRSDVSDGMDDFDLIGGQTANTPYGTLYRFSDDPKAPFPFKGVQHGQFALTKLVLVDKFGQAIACPTPKRRPRPGSAADQDHVPEFVHPCLSEQLLPSQLDDGNLNTIYTTADTHDKATTANVPMTPFIQLNPAINQNARLNASFLEPKADGQGWTPCSEWENPIFGWLIVNYADSSLQFFTADGTFYTSRQFGGPTGTIASRFWLPFERPSDTAAAGKASPQLINLINALANADYLEAVWEIVQAAIPSMPFPPSDYAPYANAIIGKPLALVNVGFSLELSQPPLWRQHTLPMPDPVDAQGDPERRKAKEKMDQYKFKIKIGDKERPFDGVVGYWKNSDTATSTATNFAQMFSYSVPLKGKDFCTSIEPANFPTVTPYFLEPTDAPPTSTSAPGSASPFVQLHTDKMRVVTMLIDPYAAIHVYSGVLPIKNLQLPPWTIAQGLKNMTAFFTAGPILITKDVPATYDPNKKLEPNTWLTSQTQSTSKAAADPGEQSIRLPIAGSRGMWNWLQPYLVNGSETHYNALPVEHEDGKTRDDPAPFTLVEGYVSLARALGDEVPKGGG